MPRVLTGGKCVAPDVCECKTWWNTFRDGKGIPVFQKPNGDPQNTGWTGYDCNTPICVQALKWVPIRVPATLELVASDNSGDWYQAACPNATRCVNVAGVRLCLCLCRCRRPPSVVSPCAGGTHCAALLEQVYATKPHAHVSCAV
jgi:hypothetical protein